MSENSFSEYHALHAERFAADKRVQRAKELIEEALVEQQREITTIRPPQCERVVEYQKMIDLFAEERGGALYYPYLGSGFGKGPLVELLDGSIKYDFIGGIGVHYFGHSHPAIVAANVDAALSNTAAQGNLQQNSDSWQLTELLLASSKMDHCFLTTSGAMANENALKILFQHRAPARRLLAFEKNFSGRTLAVAAITDKPAYRQGLPPTLSVDYLPFYDYRDPEGSGKRALDALRSHLERYPGDHAAMMCELVQGEGGFYPGSRDFFLPLMELCKERGVAIFVDEVQTFGRLPAPFAFQYFALEEFVDIVTIGKLSQTCATLFRKELLPKPGLLSQTFTSSTAMIRTGSYIISNLLEGGYFGSEGKIAALHDYTVMKLKEIEANHPGAICGPYGIGAMVAFTPLGGDAKKVVQFSRDLYDAGVISFITGSNPTRIRFLLPVGALEKSHIDEVAAIVEKTLLKSVRCFS